MRILIRNIGRLCGILPAGIRRLEGRDMGSVAGIDNAWLVIEDGVIASFGAGEWEGESDGGCEDGCEGGLCCGVFDEVIDAEGGWVMPTFCDPHTHIVYAGSRDGEFRDKIAGLSYEEIAARGGGILNSADLLHETSEDELFEQSARRVREVMAKGTGALEIKSGYGLRTEDELKMLRVIRRIREEFPITVKATFLGAHAVGRDYLGRRRQPNNLCRKVLHNKSPFKQFCSTTSSKKTKNRCFSNKLQKSLLNSAFCLLNICTLQISFVYLQCKKQVLNTPLNERSRTIINY